MDKEREREREREREGERKGKAIKSRMWTGREEKLQ